MGATALFVAVIAAAPTIASVTPSSGPATGGTVITIVGTDFVTGAAVTVGGAGASNVVVSSSSSITATTPSGTPANTRMPNGVLGAATVTVTNPDGQSGSKLWAFSYDCAYKLSVPSVITAAATGSIVPITITTQNYPSLCSWTASTTASFVTFDATSVLGSGTVTATVGANTTIDPRIATLTIAGQTVTVTQPPIVTRAPFGLIDTPLEGAAGLSGSLAVTGWALDDVQVARVRVYRRPIPTEPVGTDIYIGDAVIVAGARPDVAATYSNYPYNSSAGWGYLLLTNMLPNRGDGTYTLHIIADDVEGKTTDLGTRTITCANSTSTTPFGAIDTPTQGMTVTGAVTNFGWVLSPAPARADVPGGGTVTVIIDGAPAGAPTGWTSRADLSALFPAAQFPGINYALAVYTFDSTRLADGVHTIAWSVTDSSGQSAGIGSRYFTVANGSAMREK